MFNIGDKVRIIKKEQFPRYVGLVGKIVWCNGKFGLYQIETETKPPYYRPNSPPWIVTVRPDEIALRQLAREPKKPNKKLMEEGYKAEKAQRELPQRGLTKG